MIDPQLSSFLEEGLGIHVGTRDERLEPQGARGVAVKVEADGRHMVVYVAKVAAARLMPNLESNGQMTVVFARPQDERSCQVKGVFVGARAAKASERAAVMAQFDGFMRQLAIIGIPRAAVGGWITWPAVAIRMKTTAVFNQTPGPAAGEPIA